MDGTSICLCEVERSNMRKAFALSWDQYWTYNVLHGLERGFNPSMFVTLLIGRLRGTGKIYSKNVEKSFVCKTHQASLRITSVQNGMYLLHVLETGVKSSDWLVGWWYGGFERATLIGWPQPVMKLMVVWKWRWQKIYWTFSGIFLFFFFFFV